MRMKLAVLVAGVVSFFAFHSTADAQTVFTARLNKAQEIPAPTGDNVATGTATMKLTENPDGSALLAYSITVTGLSGPIRAAHFHQAEAGRTGPVVKDLNFTGGTAIGTWSSSDTTQPLTPALLAALKAGDLYINIHTALNPPGEIRGQVYPTRSFKAELNVAQEVPPPTVTGTPSGTAAMTLRTAANGGVELLFEITVDGLSGPIAAAHFHRGAVGATGPVVRDIGSEFVGGTASGVWRSTVQTQPLTPTLLKALLAGELYLNIHTALNPPGEIRGQVVPE
ncbi:MAG: CHRD domain-containing protein [Acidobacteriota bacterium]|nr:CHRD domain-containing protein [Blastocatellia bacterium]MDW8241159.1 CHRD domain-containing protein [Acidobacteriota bacterium]